MPKHNTCAVNAAHANPEPWVKTAGLAEDNNNIYAKASGKNMATNNRTVNIAQLYAKLQRLNVQLTIYPAIQLDRDDTSQQLANALEAAIDNVVMDFAREHDIRVVECISCGTLTHTEIDTKRGKKTRVVRCYGCIDHLHILAEYSYGFDHYTVFAKFNEIKFGRTIGNDVRTTYVGDE
jgi:Zn ribbon nucleic-acid-binding protein